MDEAKKTQEKKAQDRAQEMVGQAGVKAVETMTVWAEANQRVLRELVELSAATAKEGVRLYAELQQSALDAVRETQAAAFRWQATWQDAPKDPVAWYQKALVDSVDGAQKTFRLIEGNAQAVTRSAERLQTSAEQAGKSIQETFTAVAGKMKDIYPRN
jgi:hypothetical protein